MDDYLAKLIPVSAIASIGFMTNNTPLIIASDAMSPLTSILNNALVSTKFFKVVFYAAIPVVVGYVSGWAQVELNFPYKPDFDKYGMDDYLTAGTLGLLLGALTQKFPLNKTMLLSTAVAAAFTTGLVEFGVRLARGENKKGLLMVYTALVAAYCAGYYMSAFLM